MGKQLLPTPEGPVGLVVARTTPATESTSRCPSNAGVCLIVGVSLRAVGLPRVVMSDCLKLSRRVLRGGDRLQVLGIDAEPYPAEMVDVQAIGNRSDEHL